MANTDGRTSGPRANAFISQVAILTVALGAMILPGMSSSASAHEGVNDEELTAVGAGIADLANAGDIEAIQSRFTPAIIVCPGQYGPQPVCDGRPTGVEVQGYWVGPLYSEAGAVDYTVLGTTIGTAINQVGGPLVLATLADRAPFEFLREQCATCRTVALAAPATAAGQSALLLIVRSTDNGPRIFSMLWGPNLVADERVFVNGGSYTDGTTFVRVGVLPPQVGTGLEQAGRGSPPWRVALTGATGLAVFVAVWGARRLSAGRDGKPRWRRASGS